MDILKLGPFVSVPENYTGIVEYSSGNIHYFLNREFHREDGPAIIWDDGTIFYCLYGKLHREDGPAIIYKNGALRYYLNDNNITKEVNEWLSGETDIPPYEKWDNNTRLIFIL